MKIKNLVPSLAFSTLLALSAISTTLADYRCNLDLFDLNQNQGQIENLQPVWSHFIFQSEFCSQIGHLYEILRTHLPEEKGHSATHLVGRMCAGRVGAQQENDQFIFEAKLVQQTYRYLQSCEDLDLTESIRIDRNGSGSFKFDHYELKVNCEILPFPSGLSNIDKPSYRPEKK